jgi:hypothetical protein
LQSDERFGSLVLKQVRDSPAVYLLGLYHKKYTRQTGHRTEPKICVLDDPHIFVYYALMELLRWIGNSDQGEKEIALVCERTLTQLIRQLVRLRAGTDELRPKRYDVRKNAGIALSQFRTILKSYIETKRNGLIPPVMTITKILDPRPQLALSVALRNRDHGKYVRELGREASRALSSIRATYPE